MLELFPFLGKGDELLEHVQVQHGAGAWTGTAGTAHRPRPVDLLVQYHFKASSTKE